MRVALRRLGFTPQWRRFGELVLQRGERLAQSFDGISPALIMLFDIVRRDVYADGPIASCNLRVEDAGDQILRVVFR
jgi:hypothetical protein